MYSRAFKIIGTLLTTNRDTPRYFCLKLQLSRSPFNKSGMSVSFVAWKWKMGGITKDLLSYEVTVIDECKMSVTN